MALITDEQRIALENFTRYRSLCKQAIKNRSSYLNTQNGTVGNLAGLASPELWARQRFLGAAIILSPESGQDYDKWRAQMTMFLKGHDVWTPVTPDTTEENLNQVVTDMIGAQPTLSLGKFEELAELAFAKQATTVTF